MDDNNYNGIKSNTSEIPGFSGEHGPDIPEVIQNVAIHVPSHDEKPLDKVREQTIHRRSREREER